VIWPTALRQAVRALGRNWLQTSLSILGISVGVAAFICVVAIGNAGTRALEDQLKNLGDNFIWVEAGSRNRNGIRMGARGTRSLVLGDGSAILEQVALIKTVTPNVDGHIQVIYGGTNWYTQYRGVTPDFVTVRRWRLQRGSFFTTEDVEDANPVCVLGHTVVQNLFGAEDPVGKTIRMSSVPCQVVGVLRSKGFSATGYDQDDFVVMPFTTVQKRITGSFWLDDIFCSAVSNESMPAATRQITGLLRERHHLNPGEDNDFNIRRPEDAIQTQLAARQVISIFLASVAALALIVGGIGIMNIMLVSVTQRTREIGIRMAAGATEWDIQSQFLTEALLIGLAGGSLGMLLGFFSPGMVESLLGFPAELSFDTFLWGAAFAAVIAVFFGYYPANKAAQLDPIEALRYE
jgi:putative ABC transport system permease protein